MTQPTMLKAGVNLGGWLSQYSQYSHPHFQSFIHEEDIRLIKSWGMDHIRLPVDYSVLENPAQPFTYQESGFGYLELCLSWCKQAGLKVVLDLHKAPGFSFDDLRASTLFDDAILQERFLALWREIALHFQGEEDYLIFELLNEILLPDSRPWNVLVQRAVETIRRVDTHHTIMIGGNYYNAPSQLAELEIQSDTNLIYTFHFYEPLVVTHQKASWVPGLNKYPEAVDYPDICTGLDSYLGGHPEYQAALGHYRGKMLDQDYLLSVLQPALDFREICKRPVYCGEFGVIDRAPTSARRNWNHDLVALLNHAHIGHAYWSYKEMDFGLVDKACKIIDEDIVRIVSSC